MAAKIILQRQSEFLNKMRGVTVSIDDTERGSIKSGGAEEYIVEPGEHKVSCKLSWYKTDMNVTVNEGETRFLRVRMGMKYFGPAYVLLLLAILSDLIPRFAKFPKPDWWPWAKLVIVVPIILYYLYYLTIGKKHYLLLEEDKKNIFN